MIKFWLALLLSASFLASSPLSAQVSIIINNPGSSLKIDQKSDPDSEQDPDSKRKQKPSKQKPSNKRPNKGSYLNPAYPFGPPQNLRPHQRPWPPPGFYGYLPPRNTFYYSTGTKPDKPQETGYYAGGRSHHANNWRTVNLRDYSSDGSLGTGNLRVVFYDRLSSRDFSLALKDLSLGVFGALMSWPNKPSLVGDSYALNKLFTHLGTRIAFRLANTGDIPEANRQIYGQELVYETLAKVVDAITIDSERYLVRFRVNGGGRSPWVAVPVVFPK
ncbi:MAG: hypothetical protein LBE31_08325 [Deltaproteobacteria bacterium]|jgi:hypothetical protein|nr:hypothetical protein [Deltaproteobacteria bacterium]